MASESKGIKAIFEQFGITVMFLAEMLMVSRPTIYRYFDWFDKDLLDKLPKHVLDLFTLALSPDGTQQAIYDRLSFIHSDLLSKRKIDTKVFTKSFDYPVDPYHTGLEDFTLITPGNVLRDGSVVKDESDSVSSNANYTITAVTTLRRKIDECLKSYISDSFSDDHFYYSFPDHAYVANFRPAKVIDSRSTRYFYLYNYLDMIHDLLSDQLVTKCDVKFVAQLNSQVDKAMAYLTYLSNNADPYDDASFNDVVKELNRPTFDITLNKKWFVCVYVIVLVDEYPDEGTSAPFITMVEAVGFDDAWVVADEDYKKEVKGFAVYDKKIFGPFDTRDDCRKVCDYLSMDWTSMYPTTAPVDEVKGWLDAQTKKRNLNWGGE